MRFMIVLSFCSSIIRFKKGSLIGSLFFVVLDMKKVWRKFVNHG